MGNYYLVASYHDGKGNFYNERIIRIDGIKLNTLANIDFYTSGMKEDEVWEDISKTYNLNDCNLLFIRYLVNDSSRVLPYKKVLYSNPGINSCAGDLELKAGKDRKYSYFINENNKWSYTLRKNKKEDKRVWLPENINLKFPIGKDSSLISFYTNGTYKNGGGTITINKGNNYKYITIVPASGRVLYKEGIYEK